LWDGAYLLFFFFGFVLASDRRFLAAVQRLAVPVVPLGLAAFVVTFAAIDAADAGGDPFVDHRPLSVAARFLFGMTGWLWLVAIVGLLTRRRGRSRRPAPTPQPARAAPPAAPAVQSPAAVPDEPPPDCQADRGQPPPVDPAEPLALRLRLLDQAGEAVLPVYVLHQLVLVAVAFVVVGWALPAPVKYLVIVLATLLAVAAAYLLVRRTRPTRFLFGMRPAALRSTGPAGRRPDGG
jgi:hypothetical protein